MNGWLGWSDLIILSIIVGTGSFDGFNRAIIISSKYKLTCHQVFRIGSVRYKGPGRNKFSKLERIRIQYVFNEIDLFV